MAHTSKLGFEINWLLLKSIYLYIFFILISIDTFAQAEKKIELKSITFSGNDNIAGSELVSVIASKESPNWFSQFINKFTSFGDKAVYFDSLLIPIDVNSLKSLYLSNGFFKVRISYSYTIDTSDSEAHLYYSISENEQAYFRKFVIEGIDSIPEEYKQDIIEYASVESSLPYNDKVVEDKKNYAISTLRDHGYMLASYEIPNVIIDTMKNIVDVDIKFTTGKRYQISDIKVNRTGGDEDDVSDNLIKDIVGIRTGQYYSYYDIQKAQVRLYRTELFNSASVNGVISDTSANLVPINITTDVGKLYELSPEIIANDEESFSLGLGLSFIKKNFLGDARKFTIGASAAVQNVSEFFNSLSFQGKDIYGYGDLRASIEQPFLFGKTINTRLETYITGQKLKDEYNSTLLGAKLNFDFELPQFTYFNSLNAYFNLENAKFIFQEKYLVDLLSQSFLRTGVFTPEEADSLAQLTVSEELGGTYTSSGTNILLGVSLAANKTNDLFFPSTGYTLSLQLEDVNSISYLVSRMFNSQFSRPLFLKSIINSTWYIDLYNSKRNAFGVKFKVGQLLTYKGNKADIPLNQRLYAGGSNSVRGWGIRELVPQVELITLTEVTPDDLNAFLAKGAPTGGFFLLEGSFETRNAIWGPLGSAFFIDYGNTWNSASEFRFDEVAIAAGFGLRFYSDFAPIRIDFGVKMYDPVSKQFSFSKNFWKDFWNEHLQIHIGIGEAF